MKIAHIITRLIIGGAQENTVLTCRGLAERGHDVLLLAGPETGPEGSLWGDGARFGFREVEVSSLRRAVHPVRDIRALRELYRAIRAFAPDVVHTHSSKAGILGRWAASWAGVPCVVHTIHGMSFNRTQSRLVRAVYRSLERGAARRTHRIISVADAMTRQAVDAGLAPAERFVTVRSGMDTAAFGPDAEARRLWRERWDTHPDETVVGTIARLFDNKGYDDLLDAMPAAVAGCPKLRFVWVGDGSRRDEYVRRLRDMGLVDCVVLTGLLRPDEIPSVLNGFDILVHASRWEGLPRAVVQALLTSVPAISYDNDGAPEVVVSGETGVLVPLGDTAGLASAVVDLASDASKRCAMGETGRRRCLEAFSWRRMVSEIESVYGEYLGVPREVPPEG